MKTEHINIQPYEPTILIGITWSITYWLFSVHPPTETVTVDFYMKMANNPYEYLAFPYGSRLLTPWIVHLLPFDVIPGFRYVTFMGIWFTGILLWFITRFHVANMVLAFILPLLFYFSPTVEFLITNPWYVDPLSFFFLTLAILGGFNQNKEITMGALSLSAINRPSTLLFLPVISILLWDQKPLLKNIAQLLYVIIPSIFCAGAILFLWPHISDFSALQKHIGEIYKSESNLSAVYQQQGLLYLFNPVIYRELLPCLWGVVCIGIIHAKKKIKLAGFIMIILAIAPMVAATDYFRLPFYAFPALFIFSTIGMNQIYTLKPNVGYFWLVASAVTTYFFPQSIQAGLWVSIPLLLNYAMLQYNQKHVKTN